MCSFTATLQAAGWLEIRPAQTTPERNRQTENLAGDDVARARHASSVVPMNRLTSPR